MTLLDYWSSVADRESSPEGICAGNEGNAKAAEKVFYAHVPQLYNVARRLLGNEADAEDVTQEVLLRVLCKLHSYRGQGRLTSWLHRVTVNTAVEHQRKSIRRREVAMDAPLADRLCEIPGSNACPAQQLLDNEMHELIERAIARLPEMYRTVYVFADIEELSNAAIGKILHLSVAGVKSRLHRARSMMREALTEYV